MADSVFGLAEQLNLIPGIEVNVAHAGEDGVFMLKKMQNAQDRFSLRNIILATWTKAYLGKHLKFLYPKPLFFSSSSSF